MPKTARRIKAANKTLPAHAGLREELARGRVAWWLIADVEVCAVCGEGYAYGTGYRCSGCDGAVCTFCIENRSGEYWCVEC